MILIQNRFLQFHSKQAWYFQNLFLLHDVRVSRVASVEVSRILGGRYGWT